jgi:hypothetical protein
MTPLAAPIDGSFGLQGKEAGSRLKLRARHISINLNKKCWQALACSAGC